ncbi:zinc knuckle [Ancylostoma duodenale]|uniref:Zinc knuckle n=1 Tax=Ancylostoma duodenale TaxID=51022 RepID=A0A0C2BSS4_9BILA|nr:zinc knuckle [Ancylostoma duodenale]
MDSLTEEQEAQAQKYITTAHATIEQAQSLAIQIEASRLSTRDHLDNPIPLQPEGFPQSSAVGICAIAKPSLPTIPIPIFTGKIWEFDNFWTLFQANVDLQPLTKLQKFNYLISASRGEARELLRRYAVTEDNYDSAIALLREQYGDQSRLIGELQRRLEEANADKQTIAGQRRLLETIIPRKVLENRMKQDMRECDWKMKDILATLDAYISTEERIADMVVKRVQMHIKYSSADDRRQFCQASNRCLNCAREGHFVKECKKEGCKTCQGRKHHYTLCPQRISWKKNSRQKSMPVTRNLQQQAAPAQSSHTKVDKIRPQ